MEVPMMSANDYDCRESEGVCARACVCVCACLCEAA